MTPRNFGLSLEPETGRPVRGREAFPAFGGEPIVKEPDHPVELGDGTFASWTNVGGSKTRPAPQGWDGDDQLPGPPDPVLDSAVCAGVVGSPTMVQLLMVRREKWDGILGLPCSLKPESCLFGDLCGLAGVEVRHPLRWQRRYFPGGTVATQRFGGEDARGDGLPGGDRAGAGHAAAAGK